MTTAAPFPPSPGRRQPTSPVAPSLRFPTGVLKSPLKVRSIPRSTPGSGVTNPTAPTASAPGAVGNIAVAGKAKKAAPITWTAPTSQRWRRHHGLPGNGYPNLQGEGEEEVRHKDRASGIDHDDRDSVHFERGEEEHLHGEDRGGQQPGFGSDNTEGFRRPQVVPNQIRQHAASRWSDCTETAGILLPCLA